MDRRAIIEELLARGKAKESLHEFIKQSWVHIEGKVPFTDGWHLEAICEHLEAVSQRQIRNLLINIPPRCTKSSLVSVMWPTWRWIHAPEEQFLFASYAASLSLRDSVKCRRLLTSPWYHERWGNLFRLVGDQNTKGRFDNTCNGYRIASSVGAAVTGEGGSILVCDDPNNAKDGESEVKREGANDWWDQVWSTRLNNAKTGCRVVVQQRLHESDISGHIMQNDVDDEWVKLILPMEFESARRAVTVKLPSTHGKLWQDPRTKENELLWPQQIGEGELKKLKILLGSQYNISGQLQQWPAPTEGGIIKKNWFSHWKQPDLPPMRYTIQSWDTALETGETNAYSACTTWGVFYHDHNIPNVMLLSLWRGRVEYPELRQMAKRLYKDWRDDGSATFKSTGMHQPDMVLIEAKVSGSSLIQDLHHAGIPVIGFNPNRWGDKLARVRVASSLIETGRVWVPTQAPDCKRLTGFSDTLIENCAMFPNGDSRDLVDTMTQTLLRLKSSGWVSHADDDERQDTSRRITQKLYG